MFSPLRNFYIATANSCYRREVEENGEFGIFLETAWPKYTLHIAFMVVERLKKIEVVVEVVSNTFALSALYIPSPLPPICSCTTSDGDGVI